MQKLFYLLFISLVCSCSQPAKDSADKKSFSEADEKLAILKTIEDETTCFYQRDFECWKTHFVHDSYAFQAWNNEDGTFSAKAGWDEVSKNVAAYIKDNPVEKGGSSHPMVERRNMIVKFFSENLAYLAWDQYNSYENDTKYFYSKDQRIMEKIDGKWKIANVSSYWDYRNLIPAEQLSSL